MLRNNKTKEIEKVVFKGIISHGVVRGKELVDRFSDRLHGEIGFVPYPGTLNVKIEKRIDIRNFETHRIDHILLDGSVWVDLRIAQCKLKLKGYEIECFVIRDERGLHNDDILEIIAPENLMDKFSLKYGDEVEIELTRIPMSRYDRFKSLFYKIFYKERRIMR